MTSPNLKVVFKALAVAVVALGCVATSQRAGAQEVVVRRPDGTERRVTAAEFSALPRSVLETKDHGTPASFEGVELKTLLNFAAAGPVDSLRGPMLRRVVVAVGADGYGAVIALADLDQAIGAKRVLLADRMNGALIPTAHGPLRLVVDGDGRGARWVRQVVRIEVVAVP